MPRVAIGCHDKHDDTIKANPFEYLPPPLVIHPHMADIVISEEHRVVSISRSINSIGSGREAMLLVHSPDRIVIVRSPAEGKRDGGVFDDFDLDVR